MSDWAATVAIAAALLIGYGMGYAVAAEREWERARRYLAWMRGAMKEGEQ